jgi:phosphopentomutase
MARACVIVLDAVGAGALPDAADFGDEGSSTLAHVSEAVGGLDLPNMRELGLGNMMPLQGCPPIASPPSVVGRLKERSLGKDTTTGHWELAGVITPVAMPTYPDGFPPEVIDAFVAATGRGVLGNVAASGTEIIQRLGDQQVATGKWIVYTSADSVFQVAAHERVIPLEELYDACRKAREILRPPHNVGRVIARPFDGVSGAYVRTPNRHDFSLEPTRPNHLTRIREAGSKVHGVGKIGDIFAGCDIDTSSPTRSNAEGIFATIRLLRELDDGLIFTNLVETDQMFGHRNDPGGFHRCLQEFDRELPAILAALRRDDLLILTSDHGCDPTTPSTDHSREHALLVAHAPSRVPGFEVRHDGVFSDVGATVRAWLTGRGSEPEVPGTPIPFLCAPST